MSSLDPHEYALDRLRALPREFRWAPGCGEAWKGRLRSRLREVVGLGGPVPLDARIEETKSFDGYRREKVTFDTQAGLRGLGYLLIPSDPIGPAVVAIPGHGVGVDALVGEAPADYQNQFALQCVRAGFVTFAIEPVSFGHRKAEVDGDKDASCIRDSMAALMLGETMIGWRIRDAMAALDYLATRPEVDPQRIATMGISGGGLVAFWTACLDSRVSAAVVSGYFNTFFDSILSIDHCVDNFAPGLAKVVEMPDMAALIAPRYLFVESGTEDPIFPEEAFLEAFAQAKSIYEDEGVPHHTQADLFEGGHEFSGGVCIAKLKEWFSLRP